MHWQLYCFAAAMMTREKHLPDLSPCKSASVNLGYLLIHMRLASLNDLLCKEAWVRFYQPVSYLNPKILSSRYSKCAK